MATPFHFDHTLAFDPADAEALLRSIPAQPGVFALFGPGQPLLDPGQAGGSQNESKPPGLPDERAGYQPYLTRAGDLRRRIRRLLNPPESLSASAADGVPLLSRRLNLRHRVARIEYTVTGSEFASSLVLYHAAVALFDYPEARRRLKLHTPFFLRFAAENDFPRLYVTNRLSRRSLAHTFGPFPSRAAAERYCDAILDLFKLRRCTEDLDPSPEHPGCVYQEMKKCLAPCNQALTSEARGIYSAEAAAVLGFLSTHGESLLTEIARDRDRTSAQMDFEAAASLHLYHQKTKAAAALADAMVQPVPNLRAIIVQPSAVSPPLRAVAAGNETQPPFERLEDGDTESETGLAIPTIASVAAPLTSAGTHADEAAVFLLAAGCLTGPEPLSTLGVRAVKEQTSVGSSLFAQPLMLQAVPLAADEGTLATAMPILAATALNPEARAAALLARLDAGHSSVPPADIARLSDHLSLLRRWYYRPERQRTGEVFLPNADGTWPVRRILRGAARMALGDPAPMAETDREAARAAKAAASAGAKTKVLHEGRPDVERTVPVAPKPPAPKQPSAEASSSAEDAPSGFRTRRKRKP